MDTNARTDCAKEAHSNTPPLPFEEDLLSGRDLSSGDPPLSLEEAEAIWSIFLGVGRVAPAHSFAPGAALRSPSSQGRDDARHGGLLEEDSREAGRLHQDGPAARQHQPCLTLSNCRGCGTWTGELQGELASNSWPVRRAVSPGQTRPRNPPGGLYAADNAPALVERRGSWPRPRRRHRRARARDDGRPAASSNCQPRI